MVTLVVVIYFNHIWRLFFCFYLLIMYDSFAFTEALLNTRRNIDYYKMPNVLASLL